MNLTTILNNFLYQYFHLIIENILQIRYSRFRKFLGYETYNFNITILCKSIL